MDENHQVKAGSEPIATERKLWLPPLSPKDQKKFDRPQKKSFAEWIGFSSRTLWDWLNLCGVLAIPLVVVGATIAFGIIQADLAQKQHDSDQTIANQQHAADQQQALDQQGSTILQTYIDNIQDLLLNHHLAGAKLGDDVATLARARTLTALQGLDGSRKGVLIQFLYEAGLIGFGDSGNIRPPIVDLHLASLRGASLNDADLSGTSLNDTDLSGAHLSNAFLDGADLRGTDLRGADLNGADLSGADLNGAKVKSEELAQVESLKGATMPDGSKHP